MWILVKESTSNTHILEFPAFGRAWTLILFANNNKASLPICYASALIFASVKPLVTVVGADWDILDSIRSAGSFISDQRRFTLVEAFLVFQITETFLGQKA